MQVHFSSKSNEWNTPDDLYNTLHNEFNFTLDPCTNGINNKCDKFYTEKENGLIQDWSKDIVFMNPPYGREISQWIEKAYNESLKGSKPFPSAIIVYDNNFNNTKYSTYDYKGCINGSNS